MKTNNPLPTRKKFLDAKHLPGNGQTDLKGNPTVSKSKEPSRVKLSEVDTETYWFDGTIEPLMKNDSLPKSIVNNDARVNRSQGETFKNAPYSEIYNMAVMHKTY